VHYSAIKIFNNLPHNIKDLANEIVLFGMLYRGLYTYIPFIIVKNILIIRDIPLKMELTIGFRCFIIALY